MIQSMSRILFVAACLAAVLTALPARAEDNHADVIYDGNDVTPPVHTVNDGLNNYGRVTAIGEDNGGDISSLLITSGGFTNNDTVIATGGNSDNGGRGGNGISVTGGFTNNGTVTATGGNSENYGTGGNGITIFDGFTNNWTVTATGGNGVRGDGGRGISVSGSFTNHGTVTATGGNGDGNSCYGGSGIYVDGSFTNHGTVTATGGKGVNGGHGEGGIYVSGSNSIVNYGQLVLKGGSAGDGFAGSVLIRNCSLTLAAGSTLALAGGHIAMVGNYINPITIAPGVKLVSLTATAIAPGQTVQHDDFITGVHNDEIANFAHPGPTLAYTYDTTYDNINGYTYSVEVTRTAYASSFASGNGADYMAALEGLLAGKGDAATGVLADGYDNYALLLAQADHQASGAAIRDYANRLAKSGTLQGTANTVQSVVRSNRLAGDVFADNLRLASGLDSAASAQTALAGVGGRAFASLNPGCALPAAYLVWARPFYTYGKLDGALGYSDLTEKGGGGSLGFAVRRDRTVFGLAGHYLYTDIDGGGEYGAHYQGFGLTAGAGHVFDLGSFAPRLDLSGGWSRYRLEQERRDLVLGGAARSKPDIDVWSAALTMSVPFEFACGRSIVTPELGVDFAYTAMEGFRESVGGNALGWQTGRDHTTSFRGLAGVRYEYRATDRVTLTARGRYGHEFADRQASFAARSVDGVPFAFNTRGQNAGRASGLFGAGLKARVGQRGELGLNYDLHLSKDYVGHQVTATMALGF